MTEAKEIKHPPVPKWKPEFSATLDAQLERMIFYTNQSKDLAIFKNGTLVVLEDGLSDKEAKTYAFEILSKIYNFHPDMNPIQMKDGNIMVQYNHPAYNIVINDFVENHMKVIEVKHLDALAESEVLITPLGNNKFDTFGMKSLYGRTFMFMDAQEPEIVKIHRH